MGLHKVLEDRDAKREQRVVKAHVRRMQARRRAHAHAEVRGLDLGAGELVEVEVLAAAAAVAREALLPAVSRIASATSATRSSSYQHAGQTIWRITFTSAP